MIEIVKTLMAKAKNINVEITAIRLKKPNLNILVIAAMLKNSQTISTKPKGINNNQSEIVILVFSISLCWISFGYVSKPYYHTDTPARQQPELQAMAGGDIDN